MSMSMCMHTKPRGHRHACTCAHARKPRTCTDAARTHVHIRICVHTHGILAYACLQETLLQDTNGRSLEPNVTLYIRDKERNLRIATLKGSVGTL